MPDQPSNDMRASRSLGASRQRLRKLLTTLWRDGLVESLVLIGGYVEYQLEKRFGTRVDRKYGTETGGIIPLDLLAIPNPSVGDGVQYDGVRELYFRRMLRAVRMPPETYVFVDLGSGKGRALLIAAEYPFKRIIGVEFSRELHEIARRNVARFRARTGSAQGFDLHLGDAACFDFPLEPIALHLYNPFGERVLEQVLGRLKESLEEAPRDVIIFYVNPVHRWMLEEAPFLRRVKATSQYAVYACCGTA